MFGIQGPGYHEALTRISKGLKAKKEAQKMRCPWFDKDKRQCEGTLIYKDAFSVGSGFQDPDTEDERQWSEVRECTTCNRRFTRSWKWYLVNPIMLDKKE